MKEGDLETCCPEFDPKKWNEKKVTWNKKLFIKDKVFSFFHAPINLKGTIEENINRLKEENAYDPNMIVLTDDRSIFYMNIYMSAKKPIKKAYDVKVSATFISKVFEGPDRNIKKWEKEMTQYVKEKGKEVKHFYYYHPHCPKCAEKYGINYVVLLAEI